jgi:hypothetical protein
VDADAASEAEGFVRSRCCGAGSADRLASSLIFYLSDHSSSGIVSKFSIYAYVLGNERTRGTAETAPDMTNSFPTNSFFRKL